MPLFDFLCADCGEKHEILITGSGVEIKCAACGSLNLKKMLSAPSSLSGAAHSSMPGPGDTGCCGASPGHSGCAGPGSCCGKTSY